MDKKGELTSAEIITIVLVIAGFAILLVFIYGFSDSLTMEDDICKLSVVGRATASQIAEGSQQIIPLKCTTKKVCISNSRFGGSCSQFAGEKNVEVVHLTGSDEQKTEKIQELMAQAMYSCWNNMGQGKLDLFSNLKGKFGIDSAKPTCVICSRVAISDESSKEEKFARYVLEKIDMNEYIKNTQVPGSSLTYLQTFTDAGVSSYPSAKTDFSAQKITKKTDEEIKRLETALDVAKANLEKTTSNNSKSEEEKELARAAFDDAQYKINVVNENNRLAVLNFDNKINKYELAFVFSQIRTTSFSEVLAKQVSYGAAAASGAFVFSPKYSLATATKFLSPTGLVLIVSAAVIDGALVGYNTIMGQKAAAGYCGRFTTGEKSQEGCSLVQIMPYSFKDISQMCPSIQGSP